ncbi:MAG TPA: hypothetical protein VFN03_08805 [Trueperaceae bacterium]|nr:hypothetical protein [Trueperaceae bacterium]
MSGRNDDDGRDGTSDSELRHEAGVLDELLREDPDLAVAVEALPAALDRVDVPAEAWGKLSAALNELGQGGAGSGVRSEGSPSRAEADMADEAGPTSPSSTRPARPVADGYAGRRRPRPRSWLTAAAVAVVVVGLGTWGALQTGERARLIDEQRVLAYWMANPDLKMVALKEVGSAEPPMGAGQLGRLGVVCVLPDGRALLLQPAPADRGKSYVVVSRAADGASGAETDLGRGTGNVIRFDLAGAERVVVMLASADGGRVPIAWADVD